MNYRVLFVVSCKIRGTNRGAKPTTREKESTTRPFVKPGPMPSDLCSSLPATLWTDLSPPLNSFSFGQPLSLSLLIIHLDYRSVPNFVNEKWNVRVQSNASTLVRETYLFSKLKEGWDKVFKSRTRWTSWLTFAKLRAVNSNDIPLLYLVVRLYSWMLFEEMYVHETLLSRICARKNQ